MDIPPVKLPTHKHPLYLSSRFIHDYCDGCLIYGPIKEGYRCNDSECSHVWFHKECAESSPTLFNRSLHLQHPLMLTQFTNSSFLGDWDSVPRYSDSSLCNLCGKELRVMGHGLHSSCGYLCSICDFKVDLKCARTPRPLEIRHPLSHDHPLVLMDHKVTWTCGVCKGLILDKHPYGCLQCNMSFHVECANLAQVVNYLYHSKHPLMLLTSKSLSADVGKTCFLCGAESEALLYHCSICNFSACVFCTTNPPRFAIEHQKTHEHQLCLMPSQISFTCNACGMKGSQSPYLCLQCGFSVHRSCIDLPRVININRHDHRISLIDQLGPGYTSCGVCHKNIDRYYGGYACSVCRNYAVHSQCAVRNDIWEGIELENIPEEIEDIAPFTVVGDNLIKHFSHEEHILRLNKSTSFRGESTQCKACMRPVYADSIYKCEQCDFVLHERCANLPRKKRLVYSNKPFTLVTSNVGHGNHFKCSSCGTMSGGFRYVSGDLELDIFCALFVEPFVHDGHLHPLYYDAKSYYPSRCGACPEEVREKGIHCDTCEFRLHFRCANMPTRVKSKYDDHLLSLCYGETTSDKYWCDICEEETDPAKWFYTCSDCCVTLHVDCVLGDFSHLMPGCIIQIDKLRFEVVSNSQNSFRPFCKICKYRCKVPHIIRFHLCDEDNEYICSTQCLGSVRNGEMLDIMDTGYMLQWTYL